LKVVKRKELGFKIAEAENDPMRTPGMLKHGLKLFRVV